MQIVNLGNTGLQVSRLCLGMMSFGSPAWREWVLPEDDARPLVRRAYESGINFFDTADAYSVGISEQITGRLLREIARRDEVVVATKVFFAHGDKPNQGGLSRKHIMDAIDTSLRHLDMDYVDLYQIHRWDYQTPIEETMEALHDVVKAGKARYIGASSMFTWQFMKAQHIARQNGWTPFVSMQNHYNLVYREEEREMIPACIDQGVGLIPWSPLARGFLAGTRARQREASQTPRGKSDNLDRDYYFTDMDFAILERVQATADRYGVKPAQIALAWMLRRPGITSPIVGVTKMPQLEDAIGALEVQLSDADMAHLEELYQPRPVLGHS